MAIVKMSKFNLFSFDKDRENLLKKLQFFKYVHFNDLEVDDEAAEEFVTPHTISKIDEKLGKTKWSIDLLESYEEKKSSIEELKEGKKSLTLSQIIKRAKEFEFDDNYKKLYNLKSNLDELHQNVLTNKSLIDELTPWENLEGNLSDSNNFKNVIVDTGTIFYKYYDGLVSELNEIELCYYEKLGIKDNVIYMIVIYDKSVEEEVKEILRSNIFSSVVIKAEGSVKEEIELLKKKNKEFEEKIKKLDEEIKGHLDLLEDFRIYYDYLSNKKLKEVSSENFLKTDTVDIIEGYLPSDKEQDFIALLDRELGTDYYIEIKDAQPDDKDVPIKLKNNNFVKPFESLTQMYSMPKYNEIDPTPLFAPFYFIFAGIMVGDMGYGLILFLASFVALKVFNLDKAKKRLITFFMYLGISAVIWGFIFGSFFGDVLPLKAFIDPSKDYVAMIMLSMILGGVHIFFALGIKGYMDIRDGKPLDALYDVGSWYMILTGVIVALGAKAIPGIPNIVFNIALGVMILGMVIVLLTGGREEKSVGGKIGWGVYSLYGITSYFGDFVSYIRLMALALSGSFIAIAVNIIVNMLMDSGIAGIIGGGIIFVVFQLFNMFLSFLSAYVHSARLTYVEMFNKFYEGGGIPFREMVAESNYFNIEEE
ncbi:putative V-type sodium ATPase, I subunit [Peptoniphilus sp. ING2-D1G]|nr:putative V-type sodium ATPase, I subunit [Peptoniphilus sp. ING2-D1G]